MIKNFFEIHRVLFYKLYFGFYPLNASNIDDSVKNLCINYDLLLQQNFHSHPLLFMTTIIIYQSNFFELLCFDFAGKSLKSNISLPLLKPSKTYSYIKLSVSVNNSLKLLPYLFLI